MTPKRLKEIYLLLLEEKAFISERTNINGNKRYCIYRDMSRPIMYVSKAEYHYLEPVLIKRDKVDILSRRAIRRCHGKTNLKSIYLKVYEKSKESAKADKKAIS